MEDQTSVKKPNTDVALKRITLNYFHSDFEKKFRLNYFRKSVSTMRLSLITTILLYAGFGLLDHISSPVYSHQFLSVRFLVVIPVLIAFIGISYTSDFNKYWQPLLAFVVFVSGIGIIYMLHRDPDNIYYYGGLFLIFMGGYFFVKLRFFIASVTGISLVLFYTASFFIIPQTTNSSTTRLITADAFFMASNIICMIGLYSIERLERIDFFRQKLLTEQKAEIEKINLDLENKVKNRTLDLEKAKIKAEENEKLKSAFLANMSHEIRTPMNGILGFSELLKRVDLESNKQQEYIQIIEKSGKRMLNIINDIIDIAKIESCQMSVHITDVNLNKCLDDLYSFFKPEAEKKNVELSLTKGLQTNEAIIKTDLDKLNGILTNLINNALKYTKNGSIEFGYITNDSKTQLEFYVKDTGVGIPQNRHIAIFERFIQADIEDKMAQQGAGLGLTISKSYVDMLKGKIWLESDVNVGTTFYFTLPYINNADSEVEHTVSDTSQKKQIKSLKILIVEDDEVSSQLLKITVGAISKEIISVETGMEAIAACKENPDIDLVLMDTQLPEMNGYEATKHIREFNKDIIIITQTAFAFPGDREKSISAGSNDYISKPINSEELDLLIQKYFTNSGG